MVAWTMVVTGLVIFMGSQVVAQSGWVVATVFFTIAFLFIFWYGGMVVLGASDIVIDDTGISRVLFGMTWVRITWKNMSRIVCFDVYYSRWRRNVMAYNLFPIVKPKIRLLPTGKMWITGNIKNIDLLREAINEQAVKNGVQMQSRQNGKVTIISHLI